jgi:hypothetical protein
MGRRFHTICIATRPISSAGLRKRGRDRYRKGRFASFPVYARILPTAAAEGTYTDNVVIVVTY